MIFKRQAVMFLATGGYIGRIPIAPGTFGSLIGIPIVYAFSLMGTPAAFTAVVLIIPAAVWIAHLAEKQLKQKDPGCIVIDEIAGMCVALVGIPLSWVTGLAGFFTFRVFDILKPPPVRQLDRRLSGGWGIVMDDVAAGAMANIVLRFGLAMFAP
jgi:phosphatidylglycerophosphatase A